MNDDIKKNDLTGFDLIDIVQMRDGLTWEPYRFDMRYTQPIQMNVPIGWDSVPPYRIVTCATYCIFDQHRTICGDLYIGMN